MFSQEQINSLAKEIMARMNEKNNGGERKDLQRCKTGIQNQNIANMQTGGSVSSGGNKGNCETAVGSGDEGSDQGSSNNKNKITITPSKALVIAGLLGGTLDVDSVLVDKNQEVQIVLSGSLKKECPKQKTELEMMMEKIGSMPFDQVMKAMMERLT